MKVYLYSDIHLEIPKNPRKLIEKFCNIPERLDDILILAGDIGYPSSKIYKLFLSLLSKCYGHIILITGNHEYYKKRKDTSPSTSYFPDESKKKSKPKTFSICEIDDQIRNIIQKFPNIHFLQRDEIIINNIRFIGCTLWSDPSDATLTKYMNDYFSISNFTFEMCKELHITDREWLRSKLASTNNYTTIVVTHHLPSYKMLGGDDPLDEFYASHCDELLKMNEGGVWCCGHSHKSCSQKIIEGCKCFLNPVGYQNEKTNYITDLVVYSE